LGHRRLFRWFSEIDSGPACGPGMALAWMYYYFLLSFTTFSILRRGITVFVRLTAFFLKYFDLFLIKKRTAFDASLGYYFIGRKNNIPISDKDLIKQYGGSIPV
jgi:hypothetical protein